MPPTNARVPSTTSSLRCKRRKMCRRRPSRVRWGSKTRRITPVSARPSRNDGENRGEPYPSTITSTRTPRRAAAVSCRCSSHPTLSSNRMKVSSSTSSRACAIAVNARAKNASPFSSRTTRLPSRQGSLPAMIFCNVRRRIEAYAREQRGVVGQVRPRPRRQYRDVVYSQVTQIDAVQRQQRPACGKGARQPPVCVEERLAQAAACQHRVSAPAPVVEIAGDGERRIGGNLLGDCPAQQLQL